MELQNLFAFCATCLALSYLHICLNVLQSYFLHMCVLKNEVDKLYLGNTLTCIHGILAWIKRKTILPLCAINVFFLCANGAQDCWLLLSFLDFTVEKRTMFIANFSFLFLLLYIFKEEICFLLVTQLYVIASLQRFLLAQ